MIIHWNIRGSRIFFLKMKKKINKLHIFFFYCSEDLTHMDASLKKVTLEKIVRIYNKGSFREKSPYF